MLQLRPFQKAALEALNRAPLSPQHVICVAPTGAGKSLIYEKAALIPGRRTLLITPLVALARQQYRKLLECGITVRLGAGGLSHGPPQSKSGAWIVSPEILTFTSKHQALQKWNPNLLVVDECHCLWEWGDHFRPAFTAIPDLLPKYSILQSLWLTATLPIQARRNLRSVLPQPLTEIGQFDLPAHLRLTVKQTQWKDRASELVRWIASKKEAGIIFVSTRESTIRIARLIEAIGKSVITYHGGMSSEERRNAEILISNKVPEVIVATSAFGMGMDYPHLNYVVLWQAPTSLLSLVQTIGRVGRNPNTSADALVFWDHEDFRLLEWTVQNSKKRRGELMDLLAFLSSKNCRRDLLRMYFDPDSHSTACGFCDFCHQGSGKSL